MAALVARLAAQPAREFTRLQWLPSGGFGNRLDDHSWVPVLEISRQVVPRVLSALGDAGVAGYAAPATSTLTRLRGVSGLAGSWQLWVGASGYGRAEAVLLAVMPSLMRKTAPAAGSAWR